MNEVTFETEAARLKREAAEKAALEVEAHNQHQAQQNAATSARAWQESQANQRLRNAADEKDQLAVRGEDTKARLLAARQRAGELRVEIERAPELAKLTEEAESISNNLASRPLLTASAGTVAHLLFLEKLIELWPKRVEVLKVELAAAEAECAALTKELPLIERAYTAAVDALAKLRPATS